MSFGFGLIHLIIGPMYAGKTNKLIQLKQEAEKNGKKCLAIKYYKDIRYSCELLSTHDQLQIPALISEGNSLKETFDKVENLHEYDCLFIDEIQFYPDAAVICDQLANEGYEVIVCGLQSDFLRRTFKVVSELVGLSERITHLTAIDSKTGHLASFTARLSYEVEQEVIGGFDKYIAVERSHYLQMNCSKQDQLN